MLVRVEPYAHDPRFDTLFTAYYQPLVAYVTRLVVRRDVAEDLVVDVFLALHRQPSRWIPEEHARRFLYRAAHNAALDVLRTSATRERLLQERGSAEDAAGIDHSDHDPIAALENAEALHALDRAIQELPSQRRAAVTLRLEHGMRNAEIAEVMKVSVKTVELHLALAVKDLRTKLDQFRDE